MNWNEFNVEYIYLTYIVSLSFIHKVVAANIVSSGLDLGIETMLILIPKWWITD